MADLAEYTAELKQMVLSFRVSELQVLLGFAGRNKSGRKDQLQSRALDLLKLRSAPIHLKIRELHKRYPSQSRSGKQSDVDSSSSKGIRASAPPSPPPHQKSSSSQYNSHSMAHRSGMTSSQPHVPAPLDYSSKYNISSSSSSSSSSSAPSRYPVHPDVKFKKLPFFEIKAELLKPASLVPTGHSRFQEANFVFHFTPQQAQDISMSRDLRPGAKIEHSVQTQMRFCLLETSCEQEDNFPPSICVKVNGKMCPLPNPIPTNKPGVEPKRPSRPVNITLLCKISPTVSNHISVSWASEYGRGYVIGVFLVKKLASSNLLNKLKAQGVRNADHTRALIKEKLAQDADSEIATTSLRVSLLCPLGKMRMQTPCRASTCTHLQCFDASLYIQMNEKKPTWICPVCDKPASFETLVIDGLFSEIFNATSDCTEIQFHEDGTWSPLQPKKESHVISSPVIHKLPTSTVTLSSGGSSSNSSVSSSCSATSAGGNTPKKEKPNHEVIDLTVDSSDDEEPPKKQSKIHASSFVSSPSHHGGGGSSYRPGGPPRPLKIGSPVSYGGMGRGAGILGSIAATATTAGSRSSPGNNLSLGHSLVNRIDSIPPPPPPSQSPIFRDMAMIDSPSQLYYPPATSPYSEFLQATQSGAPLYNFPGFDLFNMMTPSDIDRQVSPYSLGTNIPQSPGAPLSLSGHKSQAPASPDVISLD